MSILIPHEIIPSIEKIQNAILSISDRGKRSRLDHMHLTLFFMKEVSEKQSIELISALQEISFPPITLIWEEVGFFKRPDGSLYYIKISTSDDLIYVSNKIREVLQLLRIPFDKKNKVFHVTILRRVNIDKKGNHTFTHSIPPLHVSSISLVESKLTKYGAFHTEVARFPLLGKTSTLL